MARRQALDAVGKVPAERMAEQTTDFSGQMVSGQMADGRRPGSGQTTDFSGQMVSGQVLPLKTEHVSRMEEAQAASHAVGWEHGEGGGQGEVRAQGPATQQQQHQDDLKDDHAHQEKARRDRARFLELGGTELEWDQAQAEAQERCSQASGSPRLSPRAWGDCEV